MKLRNKKTGEIVDLSIFGIALNIRKEEQPTYHSIEGVCEDWEDYKPAEPLIKDPKSRKVVRPWLEANDLDGATFHKSSHFFHYWNLRGFNDNGMGVDIDFFLTGEDIPNLIDGKYYTKFELCGEEEE